MNRREFVSMVPAFPLAATTATVTLTEPGKEPVNLDVSVLKVQAGDTLVLRCHQIASHDTMQRIGATLEAKFAGVKTLVLGRDVSLEGVIRGPV